MLPRSRPAGPAGPPADTDLNTLLSFREELIGAEIAAFTEELYTLAQSGGIDAAFLRAGGVAPPVAWVRPPDHLWP